MRCEALQGIWSSAALLHEARILLVVRQYSSIWSGAADGKLVQWRLARDRGASPLQLLCGHSAAIVGLALCSSSEDGDGVVSVCSDGGLCLWDAAVGRCIRKRRLPASAGHPTAATSIPGDSRHICIACSSLPEEDENAEPEDSSTRSIRTGVLVIDTRTMAVLHSIVHGCLGISRICAIVAASEQGSEAEHSIHVADSHGNARSWSSMKLQSKSKAHGCTKAWPAWSTSKKVEAISCSFDGTLMLLVFPEGWLLTSKDSSSLSPWKPSADHSLAGGTFFSEERYKLLVWDEQGSGKLYSYACDLGSFTTLCCIPSADEPGLLFSFAWVGDDTFARFEFSSPDASSEKLWETQVTLWNTSGTTAAMLGKEADRVAVDESEVVTSSALVVNPNSSFHTPTMIVDGYKTGEIRLVPLLTSPEMEKKKILRWHTGAVLCLAVHYPTESDEHQLLLSGGADCCVCIWDIAGRTLLSVLHHHVAPVRSFVLPSAGATGPWSQCFISLGDDGCAGMSSMETWRTERMFPGHAPSIKQAVWDEERGYLAVYCIAGCAELLYIWDIHSGAQERVLRGPAVHPLLKHFVSRKRTGQLQPLPPPPPVSLESDASHLKQQGIRSESPFPGVAAIQLNLAALLPRNLADESATMIRMSLSMLHVWGVDTQADISISQELHINEPEGYHPSCGTLGNKGALTLVFPSKEATFQFWNASPEYGCFRALTMLSLAYELISVLSSGSLTCSTLASFYSRTVFQKLCKPCLEVFIQHWQDGSEHVRLAARTLFHAAAAQAIPCILAAGKEGNTSDFHDFLDSEMIGLSGYSFQDVRAARVLVCGALIVWYPSLVRKDLTEEVVPQLLQLVRAANDNHSATSAEILSAGMEKAWQPFLQNEMPQLVCDVLQLALFHCSQASSAQQALVGMLLPSLAAVDMAAFLSATRLSVSLDSSVYYLVALPVIAQVIRASSLAVISVLGQVVSLLLQALVCAIKQSGKRNAAAVFEVIKELVRVFPMVGIHQEEGNAKLAVGEPIGDSNSLYIHVYDLYSGTKMKQLDASGFPGNPGGSSGITALSFSGDGEGLVAFSQRGLIIRWWSLGSAWWEKVSSRGPAQCAKLLLVPPFSPKSSSGSVMFMLEKNNAAAEQQQFSEDDDAPPDLSFRLEWRSQRSVALLRRGEELGVFQL